MADDPGSGGSSHDELPMDPDIDDATATAPSRPLHVQPSALILVFFGGVLGTLARYYVEASLPHRSPDWPVATFVINLFGAFLLGLLLEALARRGPDVGARQRVRLFAGTGFCGAFTTYSTFALEAVLLTRDGHWPTALAYGISSIVLGAVAVWAGIAVAARRSGGVQ